MICKDKICGSALYFFISMSFFLFFVYSGQEQLKFMDSPHIVIGTLPIYLVMTFTFLSLVFSIGLNRIRFDSVAFLLFSRFLLHVISIRNGEIPPYFAVNFVTSTLCLCSYVISLNHYESGNGIISSYKCFFYILLIQIVAEMMMGTESFFGNAYYYKHDMALPIGSSNALAARVLPMFAILFSSSEKKYFRFILTSLALTGIVLTKSRGGILDFLLVFVILMSWKGTVSKSFMLKFALFALIIVGIMVVISLNTDLMKIAFSESDSTMMGRFDLWRQGLGLFSEHVFLGTGFYYGIWGDNPHNFIVDILMRGGLTGLSLCIAISLTIFFKMKDYFYDSFVRGSVVAVCSLLWQGLVEIVLFSFIADIMMWCIIGNMMGHINMIKNKGRSLNG